MAHGFKRVGETYVAGLTAAERLVINQLAFDVAKLLTIDARDPHGIFDPLPSDPQPDLNAQPDADARDGVDADQTTAESEPPTEADLELDGGASASADTELDGSVVEVLLEAMEQPVFLPVDPAVRILLPDAADPDEFPELAADFRRFTQEELRATKINRLEAFGEILAAEGSGVHPDPDAEIPDLDEPNPHLTLVIPAAEAMAFSTALTDLRLVLASRLGIIGEPLVEFSDTTELMGAVYFVLGVLQESLMDEFFDHA